MEKKRQAFQEFISCIPRICSSSLVTCSTPHCFSDTSPQSFDSSFHFNWSIDQIAALQPVDFSTELNASFYQLDESVDEVIRDENVQFFNQSRVLPSPDADVTDARDGFASLLSPRGVSIGLHGSPSRGFGDMSVSEAKLPTPVNVSKTRQKKKRLFSDDSLMSEALMLSSADGSDCAMDCFHSDSVTAMQALDQSMPDISPIAGDSSRVLEMGAADDTFASRSVTRRTRNCDRHAPLRLQNLHTHHKSQLRTAPTFEPICTFY